MLRLFEDLSVELVGTNVLGFLSLKDIVLLERACCSVESHQAFMEQIPHRPPIVLPSNEHNNMAVLQWFAKKPFKIHSLNIRLPYNIADLLVQKLFVDYIDLYIDSNATTESLNPLQRSNMGYKVRTLDIVGDVYKDVMEQLSACTGNVKQLTIKNSDNCMDWLTADILSRWKLNEINLNAIAVTTPLVSLIIQTCTELTSIKLYSDSIDDTVVIAIAQYCPKLETLKLWSSNITWTSLLALSERGLPLEELDIYSIPNIPTADIARRCCHALSCIRHLSTFNFNQNDHDVNILVPYMTGLNRLFLNHYCDSYIPLLTQHCHNLTNILVYNDQYYVSDILSLCCANPLLQELTYHSVGITDTTLIELIHACPHLHALRLPYETEITVMGILALSEHCLQLQYLSLNKCLKITEAAVLQLLQRCRKLTTLEVSSSSLSEETWTQLDKNTQKRVIRW